MAAARSSKRRRRNRSTVTFHARMTHSPPSPLAKMLEGAWFWGHHGPWRRVRRKRPVHVPVAAQTHLAAAPGDAVRVTWTGHASSIVQIGGKVFLLDPVWSPALPGDVRRMTPPGIAWDGIPRVDAVLVSHNHYDHLDLPTLRRLPPETPIFVPHGVGAWLRSKGFTHVHELDWHTWEVLDGIRITLVPAHHWSRRGLRDVNRTLWGGWILRDGRGHQVYFAGDTGYGRFFREIGKRYPGIDVAVLPIGAYAPKHYNGGAHMDPAEAVRAFQELGAAAMVPVHWGTFRLSPEPVTEPIEWLHRAWAEAGLARGRLWDLAIGETRGLGEPPAQVPIQLAEEPFLAPYDAVSPAAGDGPSTILGALASLAPASLAAAPMGPVGAASRTPTPQPLPSRDPSATR